MCTADLTTRGNFFHSMMEFLPRLMLLKERLDTDPDVAVLIHPGLHRLVYDALHALKLQGRTIETRPGTVYHVSELQAQQHDLIVSQLLTHICVSVLPSGQHNACATWNLLWECTAETVATCTGSDERAGRHFLCGCVSSSFFWEDSNWRRFCISVKKQARLQEDPK